MTYVYYGDKYPSKLVLPTIASPLTDRVRIDPLATSAPSRDRTVSRARWVVTQDMGDNSMHVQWSKGTELVSKEGAAITQKWNIAESTKKESPVETRMEADYAVNVANTGSIIELKSKVVLQGEKDFYYVFVALEIEYDGALHSKYVWSDTYPRFLS